MKVVRINSYQDKRFSPKVLNQHGAFLVDDTYSCEFGIIDDDTAIIKYHDLNNIDIIIDKFRFYAEHPIEQMWIEISKIQPSQFYISKDKVIINNESDVIIPLIKFNDRYISLDGHTRLYIANKKNFNKIHGFFTETDNYI